MSEPALTLATQVVDLALCDAELYNVLPNLLSMSLTWKFH